MLTLNINNVEEKINIGCRTFISLYELLHLLEVPSNKAGSVMVNNEIVEPRKYMLHTVSNGDRLTIDSISTKLSQGDSL